MDSQDIIVPGMLRRIRLIIPNLPHNALQRGNNRQNIFLDSNDKNYFLKQLKKYDVKVIGEIVDKRYGIKLVKNNKKYELKSGFDHFKRLKV